MSKRAEQKAIEVYPVQIDPTACDCDINEVSREIYLLGYEQAEKDTVERACKWLSRNYDIDLSRFRKEILAIND